MGRIHSQAYTCCWDLLSCQDHPDLSHPSWHHFNKPPCPIILSVAHIYNCNHHRYRESQCLGLTMFPLYYISVLSCLNWFIFSFCLISLVSCDLSLFFWLDWFISNPSLCLFLDLIFSYWSIPLGFTFLCLYFCSRSSILAAPCYFDPHPSRSF